jgi:hypothetical protein
MTPKTATFTWHSFQDEEFATFPKNYQGGRKVKATLFLDFGYDATKRVVVCRASADFIQEGNIYLRCRLGGGFEISEESWNDRMNKERTAVSIERDLRIHFAMLVVGGLRGFLHARQQQSQVAAFLGPVNVLELIGETDFLTVPLQQL